MALKGRPYRTPAVRRAETPPPSTSLTGGMFREQPQPESVYSDSVVSQLRARTSEAEQGSAWNQAAVAMLLPRRALRNQKNEICTCQQPSTTTTSWVPSAGLCHSPGKPENARPESGFIGIDWYLSAPMMGIIR